MLRCRSFILQRWRAHGILSATIAPSVMSVSDQAKEKAVGERPAPVFSSNDVAKPYSFSLRRALERLESLVDWEQRSRRGEKRAMRVNSKPCADLLERLGNPQKSFKSVHVTGSKGKGSTAALVAAGIQEAGYRTGTYGSPHVEVVNERVRINGKSVDDSTLTEALGRALDVRNLAMGAGTEGKDATWFDVLTAAGMLSLKTAKVQWAVVEVGMGGFLDSTNVLNAPIVVITNIALEHAEIIGPTMCDIAKEKAGITSPGAVVLAGVRYDSDVGLVIEKESRKRGSRDVRFIEAKSGEPIQRINLRMARCVLDAITNIDSSVSGKLLTEPVISRALTSLPGRMERFRICRRALDSSTEMEKICQSSPPVEVILDGAHTPLSVTKVLDATIPSLRKPPIVILAMSEDKNVKGILGAVAKYAYKALVLTEIGPGERYLRSDDLYKLAKDDANVMGELRNCNTVETALEAALDISLESWHSAEAVPAIIILGSLHLAGRVRPYLKHLAVR